MRFRGITRVALVGALCVLVGAAAGIAGGSAATSSKSKARSAIAGDPGGPPLAGPPPGGPFRLGGGPPVHSEAVVPNKAGDGFVNVTTDAGVVKSVSGDQLTITEGTKTLTYKDVTLTIPGDATVSRNGAKASLSDLAAGDHVMVSRSSDGTFVGAFDSSHRPPHPPPGPRRPA